MSTSQDIVVHVLDGGRRAEVRLPAGFDKEHLTTSLLSMLASEAGVQVTASVEQRFDEIIAQFADATEDLVADIATATEPSHGTAGSWNWESKYDPAAAPVTNVTEDESADHRATRVLSVVPGTPIASITPPSEGIDGQDVTGKVLPARPGTNASLSPGEGLQVSPDGVVVATADGVISVDNGVVSISPLLKISGCVDYETGNIDFKGSVEIDDAVRDGFEVHATDRITVKGPVEGAKIKCGGDLACPRGVASARKAEIEVAGSATIRFVRNATLVCHGDFQCSVELESSEITIGGACQCESARVSGGVLVLTRAGHIGTLGSPSWMPTVVRIGELPFVSMELRRVRSDEIRLQKAIVSKQEAIDQLKLGGGSSAAAREQLTELEYELSEIREESTGIEEQRAKLEHAMQQAQGAELHVARVVYPRSRIQHADKIYEFEQELKGPLRFFVSESGMMQVVISTQDPRPITDFARAIEATPDQDQPPELTRECA